MSEDDDELVQWSFEVEFDIDHGYGWRIRQSGSDRTVLCGEDLIDPTDVLEGICNRFYESELARVNRAEMEKEWPSRLTVPNEPAIHVNQTLDDDHPVALEIRAIANIKKAFDDAGSDDARRRVLRWATSYCIDNGLYGD